MTPFEDGLIKALEQIGATDWVGYIFNLASILIASLFSALIAFRVAKIQVEKQSENDVQKERLFIGIRLRIEKYEDIYKVICEIEDELQKVEGNIKIIDLGLNHLDLMIENSSMLSKCRIDLLKDYIELGSALSKLYSKQTIYKELIIDKSDWNLIYSGISDPISKIYFICTEFENATIDKNKIDASKIDLQIETEEYNRLKSEFIKKLYIVKEQIEEFYNEEVLTNKKSATIKDSKPTPPARFA